MTDGSSGAVRRRARAVVATALLGLLLTACTPREDDGGAVPTSSAVTTAAATEPGVTPLREARQGWKLFTDPSRLMSFELPQDWVVQPLEPPPGTESPDSLNYAVRTPEGTTAAEFHSGIRTPETPCPETDRTPYAVIGSEPLALTDQPPAGTDIEPRFVVRVIAGFRFFGSYGITDEVGGADGLACSLSNTVQGGALGRISFGDLEVLAPRAPADTGPGTVSFGTIGEAEEYYARPEFAVIREMILSLRVAEPRAG